jgi:hypothetical protein
MWLAIQSAEQYGFRRRSETGKGSAAFEEDASLLMTPAAMGSPRVLMMEQSNWRKRGE